MRAGSCWAFSALAAAESINKIKRGWLVNLSAQQLVDCDTQNSGCDGGDEATAYEYMINNGGIAMWRDYPYTSVESGVGGFCRDNVSLTLQVRQRALVASCPDSACSH